MTEATQTTPKATKTLRPDAARAAKITTTRTEVQIARDDLTDSQADTLNVEVFDNQPEKQREIQLVELNTKISEQEAIGHAASVSCAALYFQLGQLLIAIKPEVGHGNWQDWLDDHSIGERRSQRAIQIAEHFQKPEEIASLTLTKALQQSTKKKEPQPTSKRRQMIAGLDSMAERVRHMAIAVSELTVARKPLLRFVDDLAVELQHLRKRLQDSDAQA